MFSIGSILKHAVIRLEDVWVSGKPETAVLDEDEERAVIDDEEATENVWGEDNV
jgi:hypothetical protein